MGWHTNCRESGCGQCGKRGNHQLSDKQLTIVIGGKNFVYDNGTPFKLESGKITTVNLEVGRDEIKLGDVKITDWEDGSTFSGEAIN